MSFQAYINNIQDKTGKTPEDFKKLAEKKKLLHADLKAGDLVKWLKEEFSLGHGHAMAIWKYFQDSGWVSGKKLTAKKTKHPAKNSKAKTTGTKQQTSNGKELVDKYIAAFPKETQVLLEKMRSTIIKAAPKAEQTIGYGIPTFKLNGNLVHFAGYKNHIGFYPAPSAIKAFEKELSIYGGAKGSVQFPIARPLPLALVIKIVKFRISENETKSIKK